MIEDRFRQHTISQEIGRETQHIGLENLTNYVLGQLMLKNINTHPFIIIIGGTSASGKSFCSSKLEKELLVTCNIRPTVVEMDRYLKESIQQPLRFSDTSSLAYFCGFDPSDIDYHSITEVIQGLKDGKSQKVPVIDRKNHKRTGFQTISPSPIIIIEGMRAFDAVITDNADLKLLVESDTHTKLVRRCLRNIRQYERDLNPIIVQFLNQIEPAYQYYAPYLREIADAIVDDKGINFDYSPLDTVTSEDCKIIRVTPFPQTGQLMDEESLQISVNPDAQMLLQYRFKDKLLLESIIQDDVVKAMSRYYSFS